MSGSDEAAKERMRALTRFFNDVTEAVKLARAAEAAREAAREAAYRAAEAARRA